MPNKDLKPRPKQSEQSDIQKNRSSIVVAMISIIGGILAAILGALPQIIEIAHISTPATMLTPCDEITHFQITSPPGLHGEVKAGTPVPGLDEYGTIKWRPDHCAMDVDVYREEYLILRYKSALSGTIDIKAILESNSIFQVGDWITIVIRYRGKLVDKVNVKLLSGTQNTSKPTGTPVLTNTITSTSTPKISHTPNPTQTFQSVFNEIDNQFAETLKGNIAFNKPEQMKKGDTTTLELILSPSLSESALATQVVQRGGFATSTAEPNVLIAPNGEKVTVTTSQIEITPLMKAVLKSQDPEAFTVTEMHDNAEQVVSSVETTTWRWSVTAKKEGQQTLELVIYQLVKYDGKEFWHEVETYKADIVVEVTLGDRIKSLDWKWVAGFIITLIGSLIGILTYRNNLKSKIAENKPAPPKRIK